MTGLALWLLLGLLLLPTIGAILARLLSRGGSSRAAQLIGVGGFVAAVACLIALQLTPLDQATLGRLNLFVPSSNVVIDPNTIVQVPTVVADNVTSGSRNAPASAAPSDRPTARATATDVPATPTIEPTDAPTATTEPTDQPTATPEPTAVPTPTDVPEPTAAPPDPPDPPVAQARRYVVESGDTLRSIAAEFDVSVEAILRYNGLTPEEGDSLQVGQEIFIPAS